MSFLTISGEVGLRSSINWGQRGKRDPNEAYVRVQIGIARSGFFPKKRIRFIADTDDGISLELCVEQQNDKAITTPRDNACLGRYLRDRIGVRRGALVRRHDLGKYGRTDVTFFKLGDLHFFMDFSPAKEG
ncbi:MAG: NgoFVII family restriction endonuclease [Deltaproteobacteria bacterium]|nr:NgoFVII family restriction endonuclease [Deltaproteobacteria bacterium]